MKHVMYGGKSVLLDDDTADALLEYAGLLPATNTGDSVTIRAVSPDGNDVDMTLLLNASTVMVAESTNSTMDPPLNEVVVSYLRERIAALRNPPMVKPETAGSRVGSGVDEFEDYEL